MYNRECSWNFVQNIVVALSKEPLPLKHENIELLTWQHMHHKGMHIFQKRMNSMMKALLEDDCDGFGKWEVILYMRVFLEKQLRMRKDTYLPLVDIEKAFNTTLMFEIRKIGITYNYRSIIHYLHKNNNTVNKTSWSWTGS